VRPEIRARFCNIAMQVKQQLGPTRKEDLEAALADDFEFVAPLVGPLSKSAIVEATEGACMKALPGALAVLDGCS
jgi:hypothetical protein